MTHTACRERPPEGRQSCRPSTLTVATLNVLDDLHLWEHRAPLVLEGFRRHCPDVIALQEVSLQPDTAQWLAGGLGDYSVHLCPASAHPSSDSLALLCRQPVCCHEVLPLLQEGRQAHRIELEHGGTVWTVVNTHLYWNPLRGDVRVKQAERLLRWIEGRHPLVLCGDFNALPASRCLSRLEESLDSAHRVRHGQHAAYTYPTGLRRGPGLRHSARDAFFRVNGWLRLGRNEQWRASIDHIFVGRGIEVESCHVIFEQPSPTDDTLYASDHLGVLAALRPGKG